MNNNITSDPFLSDNRIATGGDMDHPRALTPYQVKAIYEAELARLRVEPKVFLTKWNGGIAVAFRIGNQTFTLDRIEDSEEPPIKGANWQANMLRSAFKQERVKLEDDPLLSMFNNNEPLENSTHE